MTESVDPPLSLASTPACGVGEELLDFVAEILPFRRCITGEGLRQTLAAIGRRVPVETTRVPSGAGVGDWTVPPEWRVREAYVALPDGRRVVDWSESPLHLVQYSTAVRERMALRDLRPHLHTLPEQPALVPYRTSYYAPSWGFCLSQDQLDALAAEVGEGGELDVVIDAEHVDGFLDYGEVIVPGETDDEILVSAHACHPALANDNASSLAVATFLARGLLDGPRPRHTVRFLFAPGTVGAVAWLAAGGAGRVRHGLVLANLGDGGGLVYKRSRRGTLGAPQEVDRAVEVAARDLAAGLEVRPFTPDGYDERQFSAPAVDLAVGRLTRTPHGEYPEYHTSGDSLDLLRPESLAESLAVVGGAVEVLDQNARYCNNTIGEPHLGTRGLYGAGRDHDAVLWTLSLSDGEHGLLDVAERGGLPFAAVRAAADRLLDAGLLRPAPSGTAPLAAP